MEAKCKDNSEYFIVGELATDEIAQRMIHLVTLNTKCVLEAYGCKAEEESR